MWWLHLLERLCRFLHPPGLFKDEPFVNGRFGLGLRASVSDVGHVELHDHTFVSRLVASTSSFAHALDEIWLACRFEEPPLCSFRSFIETLVVAHVEFGFESEFGQIQRGVFRERLR